jgi:hypothetical protein
LHKIGLGIAAIVILTVMTVISNTYALTQNELNEVEKWLNFTEGPNSAYNKTYLDDFIKRHATPTEKAMEAAARIIDLQEKSNHTCDNVTPAMNTTTC